MTILYKFISGFRYAFIVIFLGFTMDMSEYSTRKDEILAQEQEAWQNGGIEDIYEVGLKLDALEDEFRGVREIKEPTRFSKFAGLAGNYILGGLALAGLAITGAAKDMSGNSLEDITPYFTDHDQGTQLEDITIDEVNCNKTEDNYNISFNDVVLYDPEADLTSAVTLMYDGNGNLIHDPAKISYDEPGIRQYLISNIGIPFGYEGTEYVVAQRLQNSTGDSDAHPIAPEDDGEYYADELIRFFTDGTNLHYQIDVNRPESSVTREVNSTDVLEGSVPCVSEEVEAHPAKEIDRTRLLYGLGGAAIGAVGVTGILKGVSNRKNSEKAPRIHIHHQRVETPKTPKELKTPKVPKEYVSSTSVRTESEITNGLRSDEELEADIQMWKDISEGFELLSNRKSELAHYNSLMQTLRNSSDADSYSTAKRTYNELSDLCKD